MNTLGNYLSENRTVKGEKHTHTRIGNKENNVFGGSYCISKEDESRFKNIYYNEVITKRRPEYLTEKQLENGPIAIDLDIHYRPTVDVRLHDENFIHNIIDIYIKELQNFYEFKPNDEFNIYVMEKKNVNPQAEKTKDGIHIIFGLNMKRKYQIELRNRILKNKDMIELFETLPLINNLYGVFDNTITEGTTNWQLYGSRKPRYEPYELTYNMKATYCIDEFMLEVESIEMTEYLFNELSIRNTDRPTIDQKTISEVENLINNDTNKINKINKINENRDTIINYDDEITRYKNYMDLIELARFNDYSNWFKIQRASANLLIPFEVYNEYMTGCDGYNYDNNFKVYHAPPNNKETQLGFKFIYDLAKEDNPEGKAELDEKYSIGLFNIYRFIGIQAEPDESDNKIIDDIKSKIEAEPNEVIKKELHKTLIEANKQMELKLKYDTYKLRKIYFEKYHFKIMSPFSYVRAKENGFDILTSETLNQMYKNLNGFVKTWQADYNIKTFEGCDFAPQPIELANNVKNLYTGLAFENMKCRINETELVKNSSIFIKHLWYLSGKNNKVLEYVLNYLAHLIQETGEIPRTSIVFKSEQGCGKNVFFENFGNKILGEKYVLATANMDHILGRFPLIEQKLLVLMDETSGKDSFLSSDKIKSYITAPTIPFEKKGIDIINIRNCGRMIFFTNNDYPVKIEPSDRRFVVSECSSDIKNNTVYFKALIKAFNTPYMVKSFALYLKTRNIENFDTTNDRPITQIYKEIQTATVPSEERFFVNFDEFEFNKDYSGKEIYALYTYWASNNRIKSPIVDKTFLIRIKKYDFVEYRRTSIGRFYTLDEKQLTGFIQTKQDKEDEEDEDYEFPIEYSRE